MAGSLNKVSLIGNVGNEPEIRSMNNGERVASFSLATSESWVDRNSGERQSRTEWHRVSVFNENLVNVIEKYVNKGSKLFLEGQLRTRKWQDQSGQDRYTTEVILSRFKSELVLLDSRNGAGSDALPANDGSSMPAMAPSGPTSGSAATAEALSDFDDDIPF